jgi:hypothetical protein
MLQIPKEYDIIIEHLRDRETGRYFIRRRKDAVTRSYIPINDQKSIKLLENFYKEMVERGAIARRG